jgi:hypothetical protein
MWLSFFWYTFFSKNYDAPPHFFSPSLVCHDWLKLRCITTIFRLHTWHEGRSKNYDGDRNFFLPTIWFAVRRQNDDERAKKFAQGGCCKIGRGKGEKVGKNYK